MGKSIPSRGGIRKRRKELRRQQGSPAALSIEQSVGGTHDLTLTKASTHKGRKILEAREPQLHEADKKSLILKGHKASSQVQQLLGDLHLLRKPLSVLLRKSHPELRVFDDVSYVEHLCKKNDTALFCVGSSNKKRPFDLCMGRTFAGELLDVYEFSVSEYLPLSSFSFDHAPQFGSKPLVVCQGAAFDSSDLMKKIKSLLFDFFSGPSPQKISLKGVDHVIVLTALDSQTSESGLPPGLAAGSFMSSKPAEDVLTPISAATAKILFRHYAVVLKKSVEGPTQPRVELVDIGPSFSMTVDRTKLPDVDRWKESLRKPKMDMKKKTKNFSRNEFGDAIGRVHVGAQETQKIYTPHFHLKKSSDKKERQEEAAGKVQEDH